MANGAAPDDFVAVGTSAETSVGIGAAGLDDSPFAGSVLAPHAINVAINTPRMATSRYFAGLTPAVGCLRSAKRSDETKSANLIELSLASGIRAHCTLIGNPLAVAGLANLLQQPRARRKRRKEARVPPQEKYLRPTFGHEGGIVNCCSAVTLPTRVHGVKPTSAMIYQPLRWLRDS